MNTIRFGAFVAFSVSIGAVSFADPLVIAHRGASGYLPEHTLEGYAMAYAMGADFIEPDLVLTKDEVFICLHDIHLEDTTNVEEAYPERKREDGRWYAADFTLAEIKTLEVHERMNGRFPKNASKFEVPTFSEMIELIQGLNAQFERNVGIYPELKGPSFHEEAGLPMEEAVLEILEAYGYAEPSAPVFIQCFEDAPLKKIRHELKSTLPLIFLIGGNGKPVENETLDAISGYATGIGPNKGIVEADPTLVSRAHARNLQIHVWTLRNDSVGRKYSTLRQEMDAFVNNYRVDGIFTDFPDMLVRFIHGVPRTDNVSLAGE